MSNTIKVPKCLSEEVELQLPIFLKHDDIGATEYVCVTGEKSSIKAHCHKDNDMAWITLGVSRTVSMIVNYEPSTREEFEEQFHKAMKCIVNSIPKA